MIWIVEAQPVPVPADPAVHGAWSGPDLAGQRLVGQRAGRPEQDGEEDAGEQDTEGDIQYHNKLRSRDSKKPSPAGVGEGFRWGYGLMFVLAQELLQFFVLVGQQGGELLRPPLVRLLGLLRLDGHGAGPSPPELVPVLLQHALGM